MAAPGPEVGYPEAVGAAVDALALEAQWCEPLCQKIEATGVQRGDRGARNQLLGQNKGGGHQNLTSRVNSVKVAWSP